jgi:KamA family protein
MAETHARMADRRNNWPKYVNDIESLPHLAADQKAVLPDVTGKYAFRANEYYLGLIDWNDPDDPIHRLIIPHERELKEWGHLDASNETSVTVCKGVQHKYSPTVILLVTEMCGGFCRYCFRKRLFLHGSDEAELDITPGLQYIREHPEINNILVTGGDPLILSTRRLKTILAALDEIDHVRIIRIGTKMPAFNPFRFIDDPDLIDLLQAYSRADRRIYLMCHFDHPRELTPESREAIRLVLSAGVICVNQSPIIRGISDDAAVMSRLWNELSYMGVPQYYIFQNRPTAGNEPYTVPLVEAYQKIEQAKHECSGLAKRLKYVMSHESGKVEILGLDDEYIYLKYHGAKHSRDAQRLLICHRDDRACWLDGLQPAAGYENQYFRSRELHSAAGVLTDYDC